MRSDLRWTEHEAQIIHKRLHQWHHSVQEVADYFGVSRQRLHQIMKKFGIQPPKKS